MDKGGTDFQIASEEVVDLANHWPGVVPVNGFEWVDGVELLSAKARIQDHFLVRQPGPVRHVPFSDDLWTHFYNVASDCSGGSVSKAQAAILRFSNEHGALHQVGDHFHRRLESMRPEVGERFQAWLSELRKFRDTVDLWHCLKDGRKADIQRVRTYCEPLYHWKPGSSWSLAYSPVFHSLLDKPLLLAKRVVLHTINSQLVPVLTVEHKCWLPKCGFTPGPDISSQTSGMLRADGGRIQLMIVSSDLLKSVWLQLAAYVAGQRKAKKCEAPDCGLLMDVTDSPRPGAKRMHQRCEERLRKQRYRENKRREGMK